MKLALIPPLALLPWTLTSDYHLMLPQLVHYDVYDILYSRLCADPTQYVILDNGAAEGALETNAELYEKIEAYQPNEFVIPDRLGDSIGTVKAVKEFMEFEPGLRPNCALGFVAAGKDIKDAQETVSHVMDKYEDEIDVVYVPRSLIDSDPHARLYVADYVNRWWPNKEIHFLGTNPKNLREVELAAASGMVRGVDTSAPFNYAFWGRDIRAFNRSRPEDYFKLPAEQFNSAMVRDNIDALKIWADA